MSPSRSEPERAKLRWVKELLDDVPGLPDVQRPRPYWSQRLGPSSTPETWATTVRRVRGLIAELEGAHFFAETLGFECVDGNGETNSSPELELGTRVGKADLGRTPDPEWSEADLCDYIEVFHDLAARPTRGWYHDYCNCGFHPSRFSRKSGRQLYRWRINRLLATTPLDLRLAEEGEDVGRMTRVAPSGLADLPHEALDSAPPETRDEVAHAVALFRARSSRREEKRSAIVALAGILEHRRDQLKSELPRKDEAALFEIANRFDLRHRNDSQLADYDDSFLDWIFFWYLGTVHLTDKLLERQESEGSASAEGAGAAEGS